HGPPQGSGGPVGGTRLSETPEIIDLQELACAEVWGGNGAIRRRVVLPGLEGHVLSQPCGGGQGGDVYYVTACSMGLMTRVCLADVAGHGEAVSAMSRWLHTTLAS